MIPFGRGWDRGPAVIMGWQGGDQAKLFYELRLEDRVSLFMPQTPECRGLGAQLVGHQQLRYEAWLLEQLRNSGRAVPIPRRP
jgi:hypothetical protein